MKRSNSSEFVSEKKRFESYTSSPGYQSQNKQSHQQKQYHAQHQVQQQHQQYQTQQQQQFQAQQQIQAVQQQQQYAANQQYYSSAAYYPMNPVNYPPYGPPLQQTMMYNNSPPWNYMSASPPYFNGTSGSSQPPLPPPEIKTEKPPLPKEPEPHREVPSTRDFPAVNNFGGGFNGIGVPPPIGGPRMRGMNVNNGGIFNGYNGGRSTVLAPNGNGMRHSINVSQPPPRIRRRNPHFFPHMRLPMASNFNEFAQLMEEDQPAGPEKLTIYLNQNDNGRVQINKKAKRKPMSTRYTNTKPWVREEAEAAVALEMEYNRMQQRPMLILKFPDPDLNKFIVKKYSPMIESVHFQQPSTPRYCFVQLKEEANPEEVISALRETPFGTGKIKVEMKNQHFEEHIVTPEEIDPYTLYIGNLPTHISVRVVKLYFPNALRIDIGYAQRMRYTRYAFIRYSTTAEAIASFKRTVNALLDNRSLIVRFRRQKGNIGLPGETKLSVPKCQGREPTSLSEPKVFNQEDGSPEMEESTDKENIADEVGGEQILQNPRREPTAALSTFPNPTAGKKTAEGAIPPQSEDMADVSDASKRTNNESDKTIIESKKPTEDSNRVTKESVKPAKASKNNTNESEKATNKSEKTISDLQKLTKKSEKTSQELEKATSESENTNKELEKPTNQPETMTKELEKPAYESEKTTKELEATTVGSEKPTNELEKAADPKEPRIPNESADRVIYSIGPIVATNCSHSPVSSDDEMDSKDNVLKEADEMMKKRPYRSISPAIFGIYGEPTVGPVEGDIKLEESDIEGNSNDGLNLLGTRVKTEPAEELKQENSPILDDIYLDDYEYDDIDCEPEEEDDEWNTEPEFNSSALYGRGWNDNSGRELSEIENKPDLAQLSAKRGFMQSARVVSVHIEPKPEFEDDDETKESSNEKDDLHDMFARLNSDTEFDDEEAFFG